MIGRLISGRYRIEAKVGTGGMAIVYRAEDIQLNTRVAIKVLRPEYESDMDFVARFSREAEAAAKMVHENIVNLLDVGIDGDMRYIVMEYVDGETIKDMIRREGRIHPDRARIMVIRILAAVDHAHRNGIVHRDIKPQNILVRSDGTVKVADFGIARLKTSGTSDEEQTDAAMGSIHYISPEQAQGELADEQSDLYSVGIMLYEMLTGKVPFDGNSVKEIALKHVNEQPAAMKGTYPDITPAMEEVVMRALCKDKKRRYQSAAEMAADLRRTADEPEGGFVVYPEVVEAEVISKSPKTKEKEKAAPKKPVKHPHMRMALTALAICAAVSLLLAGYFYYRIEIHNRVTMPDMIGRNGLEAEAELQALGMNVTVVNAYSEDFEAGKVMLQSFEEGERVRADAGITLTISRGTQWYELKDMTGWSIEDARVELARNNVVNVSVVYTLSDAPVDTVVSQTVEPGIESRDTPVSLMVSGRSVTVPSLVGITPEAAKTVLEAEGLSVGEIIEGEAADAEEGTVTDQSIAPYSRVLRGAAVDLTVCVMQETDYTPQSPITVVVPLENVWVRAEIVTPSGQAVESYVARMPAGTSYIELKSPEKGMHSVSIFIEDVLMETIPLEFE